MHPIILITLDGVHPDALPSVCDRGAGTQQTRSARARMTIRCYSSIFHSISRLETVLHQKFHPQYFDPIGGQLTIIMSDPQ
jgi:hypothetical protein